MFIYRNPDARETEKRLVPDGSTYKDDAKIPVFSWSSQLFSTEEVVTIILGKYDNEVLCTSLPVNVSHNVTFLIAQENCANQIISNVTKWELGETMVLGKKHFL